MTRSPRLFLSFSLLRLDPVESRSQFLDLAAQGQYAHFVIAQRRLQIAQQTHYVSQFALHRQRALGPLLAPSAGPLMEALTRLRKEKRVGVRQCKLACGGG